MIDRYVSAAHPAKVKVLGRHLRDFCIGHAVLLHACGNAFAAPGKWRSWKFGDALVAVFICSRTYEDGHREFRAPIGWGEWIWGKRMQMRFLCSRRGWIVGQVQVLADYMAKAWDSIPECWFNGEARRAGTPWLLTLKRNLMLEYGYTESQALNMPLGKAQWELAAGAEYQGGCKLVDSEDELTLQQAADIAAGKAVFGVPVPKPGTKDESKP